MASITSWTRLEPRARSNALKTGLQAQIHDPLWMLGRQWQLGEFKGEDAGSPVVCRVRAERTRLSRYHPGLLTKGAEVEGQRYNSDRLPLETMVEREQIHFPKNARPNRRLAAEAGLHFLRLLDEESAGKYRNAYITSYVFEPPTDNEQQSYDSDSLHYLRIMAHRTPDGVQLYKDLKKIKRKKDGMLSKLPVKPKIAAADKRKVIRAASKWRGWYEAFFTQPGKKNSPWIPERMEYAFAVSAPTSDGELVLSAPEYIEGHLDWYAFNVEPDASLGAKPTDVRVVRITRTVIPTPVTYRGMPAPRWWEFEDARIDFGAVEADPKDLIRMLLVEFALTYGNDWFVMPVELHIGSLCRIRSLVVTDTFGERTLIHPYNHVDGANSPWRMFCPSIERHAITKEETLSPESIYLLPPVLVQSLNSSPIEEVLLLRDEMANMAWAVERIVQSPAGKPVNRFETYQEQRRRKDESKPAAEETTDTSAELVDYRLSTGVPDYWTPLIPVRIKAGASDIRLRRGRVLIDDADELAFTDTKGRVLEPGTELSLYEEEIPSSGSRITRSHQYARWINGSTYLWIGRRKQPGRGEGSSGLRFDIIEPI